MEEGPKIPLQEKQLEDAQQCIKLKPDFVKGYTRAGLSNLNMNQIESQEKNYKDGLAIS